MSELRFLVAVVATVFLTVGMHQMEHLHSRLGGSHAARVHAFDDVDDMFRQCRLLSFSTILPPRTMPTVAVRATRPSTSRSMVSASSSLSILMMSFGAEHVAVGVHDQRELG